eukprot:396529-Pleurochrysis_carterae.AAC.1
MPAQRVAVHPVDFAVLLQRAAHDRLLPRQIDRLAEPHALNVGFVARGERLEVRMRRALLRTAKPNEHL